MNNSMVAHLWANEKQESANGSNFYFEGESIYSYGRHFEAGRIVRNKRGEKAYLINDGYYSSTTSTKGCQFIYDGLITKGAMGSICGMATSGDIEFDRSTLWTDVYDRDKNRNVRKAIEEEKKFLAEKIIKAKDSRKINIIKRYLSEYEYLLDEMPKHDFKPFERVLVRRTNQERWKLHLFSRGSGTYDEYECLGGVTFSQCIPYEGNEHLLGTNKNF